MNKSRADATSLLIRLKKTEKFYNKNRLVEKLEYLAGDVKRYDKSS